MSKRRQLENLSIFIGMRAAHEALVKLTNKEESIKHMKNEIDMYSEVIMKLAKGNWNNDDIKDIKQLAIRRCNKKLDEYGDIGSNKYELGKEIIESIMDNLGLHTTF